MAAGTGRSVLPACLGRVRVGMRRAVDAMAIPRVRGAALPGRRFAGRCQLLRADGGDLRQIANDGSSVPVPGDVLAMEPTWAEGHTAVVTATNVTNGNGTVGILEQNMNGGNGINTLGVIDDVVQPDNGMPVTGWLQRRVQPFSVTSTRACAPTPKWPRRPLTPEHGAGWPSGCMAGPRASRHLWLLGHWRARTSGHMPRPA